MALYACVQIIVAPCSDGTCPPGTTCTPLIGPTAAGTSATAAIEGTTFIMHVADHAFPEGGSLVPESIKLLPLAVNQANLVTAQGQPNHIESCTLVQRLIPGENSTHMDKNPDWHEGYTSFYVRISQRAGDDNKLPRSAILYATGTYGWVVFAPIELYPQSLLLDIDRQKLP